MLICIRRWRYKIYIHVYIYTCTFVYMASTLLFRTGTKCKPSGKGRASRSPSCLYCCVHALSASLTGRLHQPELFMEQSRVIWAFGSPIRASACVVTRAFACAGFCYICSCIYMYILAYIESTYIYMYICAYTY